MVSILCNWLESNCILCWSPTVYLLEEMNTTLFSTRNGSIEEYTGRIGGTAANFVFLFLFGIPPLCLSCFLLVAVWRAKVQFSVKVSIFLLSVANTMYSFGYSFYHGITIVRSYHDIPVLTCYIEPVFSGLGAYVTFPQLIIYGVTVNVIIWRGIKAVRNSVIVFTSAAVWAVTSVLAILNVTPSVGIGFTVQKSICLIQTTPNTFVYFGFLFVLAGGGSFLATLVIILTACYKVKKSAFSTDSATFNKALLKLAIFLFISVSILIFGFCLTPIFIIVRGQVTDFIGTIFTSLVSLPLTLTLLLVFQPIRQSAKETCLCASCRDKGMNSFTFSSKDTSGRSPSDVT